LKPRSLDCVAARTCLPRKLPLPGTFALEERDAKANAAATPFGMTPDENSARTVASVATRQLKTPSRLVC
jgi:hypothetical protein